MADNRQGPTVWDTLLVSGTIVIVAGAVLFTFLWR